MLTIGSIFAGGGLADVGAMAAGCTPIWAVEHDPAIAAVGERNLPGRMIVADVRDVDPATLETPTIFWVSPPCQAHSAARSKVLPARTDGDIGIEVLRFVRVLLPPAVCLENVIGYQHAPVFRLIVRGLSDLGYTVSYSIVDASDYQVPQSRRRLILRAVRGGLLLPLPAPIRPRIGWYAAIEDLIPTLPASAFAPWQLARLSGLGGTSIVTNQYDQPFPPAGRAPRVFPASEPVGPLLAGAYSRTRAFLVHNQISQAQGKPVLREGDDPAPLVTTNSNGRLRAFLVNQQQAGRDSTIRDADDPSMTLLSWHTRRPSGMPRAWLDTGRVVKLTPRALARLQSVPDWYALPDSATLAGKVIGNGVACRVAEMVCRNVLMAIDEQETA